MMTRRGFVKLAGAVASSAAALMLPRDAEVEVVEVEPTIVEGEGYVHYVDGPFALDALGEDGKIHRQFGYRLVEDGEGTWFPTLKSAMDAAGAGDTIEIVA